MATLKGLTGDWVRFPHFAQDIMTDPDGFLARHPVKTEDFACPQEVHTALARGAVLGEAIASTCAQSEKSRLSLADSIKALRNTVASHFGKDFIAESIPFGILFKERVSADAKVGAFFTGTGSCTFCKDNDSPDTD